MMGEREGCRGKKRNGGERPVSAECSLSDAVRHSWAMPCNIGCVLDSLHENVRWQMN